MLAAAPTVPRRQPFSPSCNQSDDSFHAGTRVVDAAPSFPLLRGRTGSAGRRHVSNLRLERSEESHVWRRVGYHFSLLVGGHRADAWRGGGGEEGARARLAQEPRGGTFALRALSSAHLPPSLCRALAIQTFKDVLCRWRVEGESNGYSAPLPALTGAHAAACCCCYEGRKTKLECIRARGGANPKPRCSAARS